MSQSVMRVRLKYSGNFILLVTKNFLFIFSMLINLYVKKGLKKRFFYFFFNCFSLVKQKISSDIFSSFINFALVNYLSLTLKHSRKSGKLYIIPWYITFSRAYKSLWFFFKTHINTRTERSLKLKILNELISLFRPGGSTSYFFKARDDFFNSISLNKHNLSLLSTK